MPGLFRTVVPHTLGSNLIGELELVEQFPAVIVSRLMECKVGLYPAFLLQGFQVVIGLLVAYLRQSVLISRLNVLESALLGRFTKNLSPLTFTPISTGERLSLPFLLVLQ